MSKSTVAGTDYKDRKQIFLWEPLHAFKKDTYVLHENNLYNVNIDFTSGLTFNVTNLTTIISHDIQITQYEIGPYYVVTAGEGLPAGETGWVRSLSGNTDVLSGYRPIGIVQNVSDDDDAGGSKGVGFVLRFRRIL